MRYLLSVLLVIVLSSCGGDIHESRSHRVNTETLPEYVPKTIPVPASHPPQTTTTTTIDPKVQAANRVVFLKAYAKFLESQTTMTTTPPIINIGSAASLSSHGPHSNAWWHGVSVCEQGGRNDPYFGYFSYMDGSAAGKTWAQQVAMANATIAKYGEDMMYGGAWAHKCVLAGYSASPSG